MPPQTRRSRRLRKRRLYVRSFAAGATAAAVTAAILVPLGVAGAGGDALHARGVRRAGLAVDPLVAASERVQESVAVQQFSRAVFDRATFERAVNDKANRDSIWDSIAACETQGNWSMSGPSFSGGVGFSNASWDAFGGREFAPNAGQATREQQIVVAERIRASVGLGAWGCARKLGLT